MTGYIAFNTQQEFNSGDDFVDLVDITRKRGELADQISSLQRQIYAFEGSYLEDTHIHGNILRGYDRYRYIQKLIRTGVERRHRKFKEEERLFSLSSASCSAVVAGVMDSEKVEREIEMVVGKIDRTAGVKDKPNERGGRSTSSGPYGHVREIPSGITTKKPFVAKNLPPIRKPAIKPLANAAKNKKPEEKSTVEQMKTSPGAPRTLSKYTEKGQGAEYATGPLKAPATTRRHPVMSAAENLRYKSGGYAGPKLTTKASMKQNTITPKPNISTGKRVGRPPKVKKVTPKSDLKAADSAKEFLKATLGQMKRLATKSESESSHFPGKLSTGFNNHPVRSASEYMKNPVKSTESVVAALESAKKAVERARRCGKQQPTRSVGPVRRASEYLTRPAKPIPGSYSGRRPVLSASEYLTKPAKVINRDDDHQPLKSPARSVKRLKMSNPSSSPAESIGSPLSAKKTLPHYGRHPALSASEYITRPVKIEDPAKVSGVKTRSSSRDTSNTSTTTSTSSSDDSDSSSDDSDDDTSDTDDSSSSDDGSSSDSSDSGSTSATSRASRHSLRNRNVTLKSPQFSKTQTSAKHGSTKPASSRTPIRPSFMERENKGISGETETTRTSTAAYAKNNAIGAGIAKNIAMKSANVKTASPASAAAAKRSLKEIGGASEQGGPMKRKKKK